MTLRYETRDGKQNEIMKEVSIKEYPVYDRTFRCPVCLRMVDRGCRIKDIVSSNFVDWVMVGDAVCPDCARLFSLQFYSYVVEPDGIQLLNVRQIRDALITAHKPPYLFIITVSKKKHLFYQAQWNYSDREQFAVNLETETIHTSRSRMKQLFDVIECLRTLGCNTEALKEGEIYFGALQKIGMKAVLWLQHELETSREIQIPLYCAQKREISEEDAICCINSTLTI